MTAALQLTGVSAFHGKRQVLHGVSLAVPRGAVVALLGANGAGKTTVLRAVTGMVRVSGAIEVDGVRVDGVPTEQIARRGVSHVPEGRGTIADLTVDENLRLAAYGQVPRRLRAARVAEAYERFSWLRERHRQLAGSLSGGEQQMLSVVRALVGSPRLLLLDEPSLGLSGKATRALVALLGRLAAETGLTVLLAEQNASLALGLCSRAYVLEAGRVTVSGEPDVVRSHAGLRAAYLGPAGGANA